MSAAPGLRRVPLVFAMQADNRLEHRRWTALLARLRREFADLPASEKRWLAAQADTIAACQEILDGLFHAVSGINTCRECDGACCGAGRHHLTLANLLDALRTGEEPPSPEFRRSCPFLGPAGCLLPVRNRPYNCITFFCDTLDAQFTTAQRQLMAQTDQTLRAVYRAIAARHPAGSLNGLWLASERLGDRPLFNKSVPAC